VTGIRLTGLASGLDSDALIADLIALKRQPRQKLEWRERYFETREAALGDVNTRLKNLKTAAADLASAGSWTGAQTAESSDSTKVATKINGTPAAGVYRVAVTKLAQAEQRAFQFGAGTVGADTTITLKRDGDAAGQDIALTSGMTLQQVADAINASGANGYLSASVSGEDLILTSKKTGAANGFAVTQNAATLGAAGYAVDGADAEWTYTAGGVTSAVQNTVSNNISGVIPGLDFTLKGVTAGVDITVTEATTDNTRVKDKVKAFVEQYNSTLEFIRSKTNERRVANPTTQADAIKGVLSGDTALTSLVGKLRSTVAEQLGGLGITTGKASGGTSSADSLAGKLMLDEAKLDAALAADPNAVKQTLGGAAADIDALLLPYTTVDGTLDSRKKEADSQAQRLRDAMTRLDDRLEVEEARLRRQFASLESLMSRSQAQQTWLTGQIAGLD
jgi:flagellar hook-associated protein 2